MGNFRDRLLLSSSTGEKNSQKKSRFFWKISRVQNCRVDHKYRSSLLRRQSYTQVYDINTDILSLVYLHRLKHTHEIQIIHTSHSIIYIVIQSKSIHLNHLNHLKRS